MTEIQKQLTEQSNSGKLLIRASYALQRHERHSL